MNSSIIAEYSYSGDQNYLATKGKVSGAVTAADTTTSVIASSATGTWGSEQSLVFAATVADSQSGSVGVPTGEVSVEQGADVLCTITLSNGAGTCSPAATALSPGTDPITASYGGDLNFNPSPLSSPISLTISPASLLVTGDDAATALRLSPADARLDDIGLCEWADPGHIWGDWPVPVHYCCHDHQSSWGVPDHVHRWVTRLPRLHIWVRTGNTDGVTGYDRDFVEISYSDSLLRVQWYSHRFGHLCRRLRQLLVRSVHPDGRFRILRRKRQPEHFPGHLLRERHVFGRRQLHGLVIERRIRQYRALWRHRLATQGRGWSWSWNQLLARRCWWYQPDN